MEDGSKPITDQVAEHVDAVRAELEARNDERIKQVDEDLAKAHQDMENLRITASVHTALTNASVEDGLKPIADQVAEHVDAVRAESDARHNERIKQVDETLEKRTNAIKANPTETLTEGENQTREDLAAEHE